MSVPCVTGDDEVIGVTGIDLSLEDLTARVTHTNSEGLYAFLTDMQGTNQHYKLIYFAIDCPSSMLILSHDSFNLQTNKFLSNSLCLFSSLL